MPIVYEGYSSLPPSLALPQRPTLLYIGGLLSVLENTTPIVLRFGRSISMIRAAAYSSIGSEERENGFMIGLGRIHDHGLVPYYHTTIHLLSRDRYHPFSSDWTWLFPWITSHPYPWIGRSIPRRNFLLSVLAPDTLVPKELIPTHSCWPHTTQT
jgi:hypothetical protein